MDVIRDLQTLLLCASEGEYGVAIAGSWISFEHDVGTGVGKVDVLIEKPEDCLEQYRMCAQPGTEGPVARQWYTHRRPPRASFIRTHTAP